MSFWLLKTEPVEFSFTDLVARGAVGEEWYGVRNYQARNMITESLRRGDKVVIYHSSCEIPGAVGLAEVSSEVFPDSQQFNPSSDYYDPKSRVESPRWFAFTVVAKGSLKQLVSLADIKANPLFDDSPLVKRGSRLSVVPLTRAQWQWLSGE